MHIYVKIIFSVNNVMLIHSSPDAAILLPATIYPKTVGGMCYAIIRPHTERVKTTISNYPIIGQGN